MKKKIVSTIIGLAIVAMMTPGLAQGATAEELQAQITQLLAQLNLLQTQLGTLQGTPTAPAGTGACAGITFTRNLKQGMTGTDVKCLQAILNQNAATQVAVSGAGSPGSETTYFGALTMAAVKKLQELYAAEVLTPLGLTAGTGFVGAKTIAKLNTLLGTVPTTPTTPTTCATDANCTAGKVCQAGLCVTPTATAGALTVALATDTPPAQLAPAGPLAAASNVPFTKVTFTGTGKISKIIVTRGGVSTDATLTGVKLFDGSTQVGTTQTFNAAHQAVFNLTTPLQVSGSKTITIAGDYAVGSSGQVVLRIQSATDITADTTVGGTFPIVGNPMTGSPLTNVGTLTVDNGGLQPVAGGSVDVDATNRIFMQMRLTAGAVEDVYINAITIARGTAATFIDADITNITLFNDTAGVEIGKVTALGAESKVTFALSSPLLIARGKYVELSVRADVLGGSNRRIAFDVNDGLAYTINAVGASYGYGVAFIAGTFAGIAAPWTAVNQGILNVSRGTNCPATGNVAVGGSDIKLGSFNFKVRGENIRITRVVLSVTGAGNSVNIANELTMFKLVDSTGNVVAGPVNANGLVALLDTVSFTTQINLNPGDNELFVVVNIGNAVPAGATYQVGFNVLTVAYVGGGGTPATAVVNVRGMVSNLPIVPTPAANVLSNIMTALRGALTADMTATPVAGNVIVGGQKATLANVKLDATASGEDVRITQIVVTKAGTEPWAFGTLSDIELWDGAAQVGLTTQPTVGVNVVTFTLTTPLVVSKGTSKTLALKANILATTLAGQTHTWTVAAPVCTTTSGSPVTVVAPATASPAQALQVNGALRVTIDASPVASAQLVAGTTNNEVVRYKFWAYDEDVEVSQIFVWVGNNAGGGVMPASAPADIASVSLWLGATKISGDVPVAAGTAALIGLAPNTLVIPKNETKVVTMKVSFNAKASVTSGTNYQFGVADSGTAGACTVNNAIRDDGCWGTGAAAFTTYGIVATGRSSGLPILSIDDNQLGNGQIFGSNAMELFDGKLVVTLSSLSPSGTQSSGANQEIARLNMEAVGDDITVNGLRLISNASMVFDNVADTANLESTDGTTVYATTQAAVADTFDTTNSVCFGVNASLNAAAGAGAGCGVGGAAFAVPLIISEGTTVPVSIRGNTTAAGAVTNLTLQLSLLDGTSAGGAADVDITWQDVSGGTPSLVATKVIPLYGNTLRY